MRERPLIDHVCRNCGDAFRSRGPSSKWCARCEPLAIATQRIVTAASQLAGTEFRSQRARILELVAEIAPRGMVRRAAYLAERSRP